MVSSVRLSWWSSSVAKMLHHSWFLCVSRMGACNRSLSNLLTDHQELLVRAPFKICEGGWKNPTGNLVWPPFEKQSCSLGICWTFGLMSHQFKIILDHYWVSSETDLICCWNLEDSEQMLWVLGVRATLSGADILTHFVKEISCRKQKHFYVFFTNKVVCLQSHLNIEPFCLWRLLVS